MTATQPPRPHEGSNGVEDPATVRRTFIWLALAAALLLLPPRQWISSGIMAGVTLLLLGWHVMRQRAAKAVAVVAAKPVVADHADHEDHADESENDDEEEDEDSGQKDGADRAGGGDLAG
jgi:hypothetical protein